MQFKNWFIFTLIFQTQSLVAAGFQHDLIQSAHEDKTRPQLFQINSNQLASLSFDFNELFDQADQPQESSQSLRVNTSGKLLIAQGHIKAPKLQNAVKKNIPNLWQVVIPNGWPVEESPVLVEWNRNDTAHITELIPWVQRQQLLKDGSTVIEGGVTIIINPNKISFSGLTNLGIRIDLKPF